MGKFKSEPWVIKIDNTQPLGESLPSKRDAEDLLPYIVYQYIQEHPDLSVASRHKVQIAPVAGGPPVHFGTCADYLDEKRLNALKSGKTVDSSLEDEELTAAIALASACAALLKNPALNGRFSLASNFKQPAAKMLVKTSLQRLAAELHRRALDDKPEAK